MIKVLFLLATLFVIIPTATAATDGNPYVTIVGNHRIVLSDPALTDEGVKVIGSSTKNESGGGGPLNLLPFIERCSRNCAEPDAIWVFVEFGPRMTSNSYGWEFSYSCTPSARAFSYRHSLSITKRNHEKLIVSNPDSLKVNCK